MSGNSTIIKQTTIPKTKLIVELHESVRDNPFFHKIKKLNMSYMEIFSFGIIGLPVPDDFVGENDFEYRESKIPAFLELNKDYISLESDRLINKLARRHDPECAGRISELLGIAVTLKYFTKLLGVPRNNVGRIMTSSTVEKRRFQSSKEREGI